MRCVRRCRFNICHTDVLQFTAGSGWVRLVQRWICTIPTHLRLQVLRSTRCSSTCRAFGWFTHALLHTHTTVRLRCAFFTVLNMLQRLPAFHGFLVLRSPFTHAYVTLRFGSSIVSHTCNTPHGPNRITVPLVYAVAYTAVHTTAYCLLQFFTPHFTAPRARRTQRLFLRVARIRARVVVYRLRSTVQRTPHAFTGSR